MCYSGCTAYNTESSLVLSVAAQYLLSPVQLLEYSTNISYTAIVRLFVTQNKEYSMSQIYANEHVYIKIHDSEIPWLKIYSQATCKEFTECDAVTKQQVWTLLDLIEGEMLTYFKPEKINIASFGNYKPQVHWHIMARYAADSFYPEPMWGEKQRESNLVLPPMDVFITRLLKAIDEKL